MFISGAKQSIHRVVGWPGQEAEEQRSKIPTVAWYDPNNKVVHSVVYRKRRERVDSSWAVGGLIWAEALSPQPEEDAEDNGWILAKHFKLHLHPNEMQAKHNLKLDRKRQSLTIGCL